jgi:ATP synthase subunit 6
MFLKIFSPLEQFEIIPFFNFKILFFDLSITNQTLILLLIIFFLFTFFFALIEKKHNSLYLIPSRFQLMIEIVYSLVLSMVVDNISGKDAQKFFPLIFSLFFFIALMNLVGLVPYSFTLTSHFVVTLAISLTIFVGINIICVKKHGMKFFSLFLPSGTPLALAFLLIPIEFILYFFRPFSLAIRLFCNMMAGHTLLKIFAGFAWSLMSFSGFLFFLHFVPLLTLLPLFLLELGVALIQSFVFSLLTCIYINDAVNLH